VQKKGEKVKQQSKCSHIR